MRRDELFSSKIWFVISLTTIASICLHATKLFATRKVNDRTDLSVVVNTWSFVDANLEAWETLVNKYGNSLDAVEKGCSACEKQQCDGTVGYGGSPDENSETTLDAMIMDGRIMKAGAVGALRRIKDAISVARSILTHTKHTLLVGDQATDFAKRMGFEEESLATNKSSDIWRAWRDKACQPNYWINVFPKASTSCGPYIPDKRTDEDYRDVNLVDQFNHDTIGMVALDINGNIAAGTSTNGASHKIPGRVGDSPIVGSGAYAENGVGGAAATGDGDILMLFLPSFKAVEAMKKGKTAQEAATSALSNIPQYYPQFSGGIVVMSATGEVGAACHGFPSFSYTVSSSLTGDTASVRNVECILY